MAVTVDDDEFGDASFLADFDVDAAVLAARTPAEKPAKRAKVSPESSSSDNGKAIQQSLKEWFGFSGFRTGQQEAIQSVLAGQDVAVFWATGSGKSICFQLPALHSQRVALVVSPLISLMQDQVHKMNGISERNLATFLGSAQMDPNEEQKAMRGDYPLVYVTPEKLLSAGFLDRAARLKLCLIAVDESHCVSQWGHDFRPEYRRAGDALRDHPQLCKIPIMALTATAVPRIQKDIISSLRLHHPYTCRQSFDRPNLVIKMVPKDTSNNALRCSMEPLVQALKAKPSSTIVYAPTRREVDEVCSFLVQRFEAEGSPVRAEPYHAQKSTTERQSTHRNFLTGKTTVVVATIAFGMGIDKPDTRRVVHYGPPKTVEDYYQQIGRAGRDGLPADCIMHASPSDFDRYHSDFYLKDKDAEAREASIQSTKALKTFCLDKETCRRKALLEFFHEVPSFGERCGTCDNCHSVKTYGDDAARDFGDVARMVLQAVSGLREQGMGTLLSVVGGKAVDSYRYSQGIDPHQLKQSLATQRSTLTKRVTVDQFKEFASSLVQKGYVHESTVTKKVQGYSRTWTVFRLTPTGTEALLNKSLTIILPVPESIRESERQQEIRRQRVMQNLKDSGIQIDQLPREEVEQGDGEVIRAYIKWNSYMESLRKNGKEERLVQLEELLVLVQGWRSETASQLQMAPAAVLAEHILYTVAYASATLPRGMKVDKAALQAAGARTRELDSLVDILNSWTERYRPPAEAGSSAQAMQADPVMLFPPGPTKPPQKWAYALYKPNKKTGKATWESSWERFTAGESPQAIAMNPANGRPIQVTTVVGHIQEGLLQGRGVDLRHLAAFSPTPTQTQWLQIEAAETTMGMSVPGDPTTSGSNGGRFTMTDLLRPIMGEQFADTPPQERNEYEKEKFGEWCQALKWYMLLKRAGIEARFDVPGGATGAAASAVVHSAPLPPITQSKVSYLV